MRALPYMRVRGRSRHRGSTAVEFALVFPLFFTLICCALEGGRFVVSRMMLSYAVSVGARAATLTGASGGTTGTVANAVVNAAPMLHLSTSQVEITLPPATGAASLPVAPGTSVMVSIGVISSSTAYHFTSIIPSRFSPFSSRTWSAQATMTAR